MKRSERRRVYAVLTTAALLLGAMGAMAAADHRDGHDPGGNSAADIDVVFDEDCRGFDAESSKDISYVEIHDADGSSQKFEGQDLRKNDQGDPNDGRTFRYRQDEEISHVIVKSGTTTERFDCDGDGGGTEGPPGDPTCEDGIDNDDDGLIDGDDPDCQEEPGTEGPPGDPTCEDGIDNDDDGLIDGDDPDCQEVEEPAFCRSRVLNVFDEALVLFEANEDGTPCTTEDGSLLNAGQLRLLRAETNGDDTSAISEVLGLGGQEGDPGGITLLGAYADCEGEDAWVLLISGGDGGELLRIGSDDDEASTIGLPNLALDDDNGLFIANSGEGKGRALALRLGGTDVLVVSEAEAHCP